MNSDKNNWNIDGIQFSILNDEEIINRAVTEIKRIKLKEDDVPVKGGLLDPRFETSLTTKPGNFGYIKLAKPVYHIGFTNYIGNILKCICYNCSSLICDKEKSEFQKYVKIISNSVRLHKIRQICDREPNCIVCKMVQPNYSIGLDTISINLNTGQGKEQTDLSAEKVKAIFSRVSYSDSKILGFDPKFVKLESLIISTLIVPPVSIRPNLEIGGGLTSLDDMTHKYVDILKINTVLKNLVKRGVENYKLKPLIKLLQYNISTHIDNTKYEFPSRGRSGKYYISIKQKLDGKNGRVRGNLMGKRVNYSARTVIGGDPSISIDEVGVPYSVAMNCTQAEIVNDLNIERLRKNVKNGKSIYPGAKYIFRGSKKYTLSGQDIPINIQNGDIVRRHIQDGDMLILNRQPTLHRLSMMGHKAKILPYSTFRLNLAITNPYNADFDGDEMNIHFPQTVQSITEVKEIMMSPQNIVSPNDSKPKTGLVQDSLLGIRKLTLRDTFIKKHTFMNILMDLEDTWNHEIPIPAIIKPKPTWTGKQVISVLLPNMEFEKKANEHKTFDEPLFISRTDTWVRIMDGNLICGILDKKSIGLSYSSIIHVIFNDMGPDRCTDFINKVQDISNRFLTLRSASAGIKDLIILDETREELNKYADNQIEMANKETKEEKITGVFDSTIKDVTKIIYKTIDHNNNFYHMKTSGSKGKTHNIPNMIGIIGQKTLSGGRMRDAFGNRTLPHYHWDDKSPRSRGYIKNCLINGLEPDEFFFLTISGREGITDTAVKTASSGYIQRRFVKSMEDICCLYDGTVRNSMNDILQFSYGGDCLNPKYIESASMDLSNKNLNDLKKMLNISNDPLIKKQSKQIIYDWKYLKENNIEEEFNFWFPYKLQRIILTAKKITYKNDKITMNYIDSQTQQLFNDIDSMYTVPTIDKKFKEGIIEENTRFMKINLRYELSIVNVLNKYKLSKTQFDTVINYIKNQYEKALVHPGEIVGITAAQSFGEPTTQMTLNTFHSAGMASANVTLGVPRVEEIMKFTRRISAPNIILIPKKDLTEKQVTEIINKLKYISFNDIIHSINITSNNSNYLWKFVINFKKDITYDIKKSKSHFTKFLESHSVISEYKIDSFNNIKLTISINVDKRKNKDTQRKLLFKIKNDCLKTKISGIKGINLIKKLNIEDVYENNISVQKIKNLTHQKFSLHIEKDTKTDLHILKDVLTIDGIEHKFTISNEMREVQETFGLEAARQVFFNEMRSVFAAYNIDIAKHHYEILADSVSYSGKFIPIARTGVNRRETGPLTKASFEETFGMFMKGGLFGEYDGLFGVSGNILLGKQPEFGTGLPYVITE